LRRSLWESDLLTPAPVFGAITAKGRFFRWIFFPKARVCMTNLTQKLVIGGAALVVGLVVGWAGRGVAGYNANTQSMTSYDSWRLACPAASQKDVGCEMIQDILDSQSHSEVARVAIGKPPSGKATLDITMPLGVALEPGIGLRFGTDSKEPLRTEKYRTCTQQGCIVDIVIDDKLQSALNAGKDGQLLFAGVGDGKPIAIPISLKGYAAAKHSYESSEAKRSSWFWRMWS
jgi:invasion protein IalB